MAANKETDVENPSQADETKEDESSLGEVKERMSPKITASTVVFYVMWLSLFVFGCVTVQSCPIEKMIPIYLIIAGATGIFIRALISTKNKHLFNLLLCLASFYIVWHGLGSYWIYKEWHPNDDPLKGPHCYKAAYLVAFWTLTLQYALVGVFIALSGCYLLMRKKRL